MTWRKAIAGLAVLSGSASGVSLKRSGSVAPQAEQASLLQTYNEALAGDSNHGQDTPVTRVVKLLQEMGKTLGKEQEEDDAQYKELACWCNNNNYEKDQAIGQSTSKISELESSIDWLSSKKAELETSVKELNDEVSADRQALDEATVLREKQLKEFHGEETDAIQAIEQLKAAIEVLSKHTDTPLESTVAGGAVFKDETDSWSSFLATRAKGATRSDDFPWNEDHAESRMVRSLDDFMRENGFDETSSPSAQTAPAAPSKQRFLQQATAGASELQEKTWSSNDVQVVKKAMKAASAFMQAHHEETYMPAYTARSGEIMGVLKQLKEEMESNLSEEQKTEQARAATFKELRAAKRLEIDNGEKMSEQKEDQLADTVNALAEAKEDHAQEQATLAEDQQFLANLKATCADADKNYQERKTARQNEMTAVSETIKILQSDEARDAMSSTYSSFLQTGSSSVDKKRAEAAKALREVARKSKDPQLSVLATTVELDSFSKVIKAIDDMVAMLKEQQAEEVQKSDWCKAEFQTNELETAKATDLKADLETKISSLSADIKALQEGIDEGHRQIAQVQLDLQRATENRKAENIEFQKTVADQTITIEVLKKALDKLATYYDLVQTKSQATSRKQTPPVPQAEYAPSKSAPGVMEMIEKLIYQAKALTADAKTGEQNAQAAYETLIKDSNGSVQALSKEILVKQKAEGKAKKDLLQTEADLGDTEKDLLGLAQYNSDLKADCDYLLKNFDLRQGARGEEIQALQQAKSILKGASLS